MIEWDDDVLQAEREKLDREIEDEARDLARNDAQIWDNLPASAKRFYLDEATREYAAGDE